MPDQELVLPDDLRDATRKLQAVCDENTAPLVGRLVELAFEIGLARGIHAMKAVVDEYLA